jgi:hypothetical protein
MRKKFVFLEQKKGVESDSTLANNIEKS